MKTLIHLALIVLCITGVAAQNQQRTRPAQREAIVIPLPSNPPQAQAQTQAVPTQLPSLPDQAAEQATDQAAEQVAQAPGQIPAGLEQAKFRIPSNTVDGWYIRGDAEGEAENLEYFLQALIWGSDMADQQAAQAAGKVINVDYNLLEVHVVETAENIDRIGNTIDPGLEPYLRRQALRGQSGEQVASGISVLPADMTDGLIRTGPTRAELEAQRQAAQQSSSSGGRGWTRHTLKQDNSATRGDLRITLIDLYTDREDNNKVTAVILLQSSEMEDEVEIQELRRIVFDQWTIRFEESDMDAESATFEIREN